MGIRSVKICHVSVLISFQKKRTRENWLMYVHLKIAFSALTLLVRDVKTCFCTVFFGCFKTFFCVFLFFLVAVTVVIHCLNHIDTK